jgi:hypothetical protein
VPKSFIDAIDTALGFLKKAFRLLIADVDGLLPNCWNYITTIAYAVDIMRLTAQDLRE